MTEQAAWIHYLWCKGWNYSEVKYAFYSCFWYCYWDWQKTWEGKKCFHIYSFIHISLESVVEHFFFLFSVIFFVAVIPICSAKTDHHLVQMLYRLFSLLLSVPWYISSQLPHPCLTFILSGSVKLSPDTGKSLTGWTTNRNSVSASVRLSEFL